MILSYRNDQNMKMHNLDEKSTMMGEQCVNVNVFTKTIAC